MDMLVWIGAVVTCIGVAGLLLSAVLAARARGENLEETALKARLQRLLALNLGALALSTLGLMTVILGLFLG